MIAVIALLFLGALLPFVIVYGALAWFLFLPVVIAWPYIQKLALRLNIPRVWVTRIAVAASLLTWISIIKAAS